HGNFTLNGTVVSLEQGNNISVAIFMLGAGSILDGSGSFSATGNQQDDDNALVVFAANTTIASTADLTFTNLADNRNRQVIEVDNNVVVTNQGTIRINPDLIGGNASSRWINDENSVLEVGRNLFLNNGILTADATGNTVNYTGSGAQVVKDPEGSIYHNVSFSGSDIKTLSAPIIVNGDITISSILNPGGHNISLNGNWNNTGNFDQGTTAVTFNGTSDQSISSSIPAVFYDLNVQKAGASLTVNDNDIQITNNLTIDNTTVNLGSNILTIGESTASVGSISKNDPAIINGQVQRFIDQTGVDFEFPIGSGGLDKSMTLNFNALTAGSVIAEFIDSTPGSLSNAPLDDNGFDINNTYLEGYWKLTTANSVSSSDFNMTVKANGFSSFGLDEDTRLVSRSSSSSDWVVSGNHVDNGATFVSPTIKRNNISILSGEYGLASGDDCVRPATTSIVGDSEVCSGSSSSYQTTGTALSTFSWEVIGGVITTGGNSGSGTEADPSIVSGQDLTSIDVTWASGGTGSVRVTEDNSTSGESNPCGVGDQIELVVQVNTLPTSAISGNTSPLTGSSGLTYAVESTPGYTYAWSISPAGNHNVINPTNSAQATIDWVNGGSDATVGDYVISVIASSTGCVDADPVTLNVSVTGAFQSTTDGNWNLGSTWGNGGDNVAGSGYPGASDNAIVTNTVTVTEDASVNTLFLKESGSLIIQDGDPLTINGDFTLDGTVNSLEQGNNVTVSIFMRGNGAILDGTGSFGATGNQRDDDNALIVLAANTTIASTADLTLTNLADARNRQVLEVDNDVVVTNLGSVTIDPHLIGGNANSTWINDDGASLSVGRDLFAANGNLVASAPGNTVEYNGGVAQNIKVPQSSIYENLIISGSNVKTLQSETSITGTLSISSTLEPGGNNLLIQGNYNNQGVFNDAGTTLFFIGTNNQTFVSSSDEVLDNLTINKTSGTVTSSSNIQVNNTLTLTGGNLDMQDNRLLLGFGTGANEEGTLIHSSPSTIIGEFARYINGAQVFDFPVGTANNLNTARAQVNVPASPAGILAVAFINSNPGSDGLDLDDNGTSIFNNYFEGYWTLNAESGLSSTDYNVDLLLNGFSSFNTSLARVITRANSGSDWTANGTHQSLADGFAQRDGVSILGAEFGIGDITNCLSPSTDVITASATEICTGQTGVTYTAVNGLAGSTYTWEVVGGLISGGSGTGTAADPSTISGLGSGGLQTITVDWGATGLEGSVQVVEDNSFLPGCGAGEPIVLTVNVNPLPTSEISGPTSASRSQSTSYTVEANTGYSYNWTVDAGTGNTISSGDGTNAITIDWGTAAGTYQVSVVGVPPGGCANAAAVTLDVEVSDAFQSVQNGNWNLGSTWGNGGDNTAGSGYPG
ncbi:MAG: hypothetical protein HRT61_18020, partial [Ekhidna sp.]|nr:hypothetical protein [Ekhidna sp.]